SPNYTGQLLSYNETSAVNSCFVDYNCYSRELNTVCLVQKMRVCCLSLYLHTASRNHDWLAKLGSINGEMVRQAALRTKGSGCSSGVDANGFRRMLACKSFKQSSTRLCEAIARMTKTLCTQYIDPTTNKALIASRLIPLDKGEGAVRPIGVGEVIRRISAKCVMSFAKKDVVEASGSLQLCAGQKSGKNKLRNRLKCQGSFFENVSKFSLSQLNAIWSVSQSKLPKNIFNFTIRYINNTLPTRKNLSRWEISSSSDFSFCLHSESLLHVVAGCQHYLERFNWRHDCILKFLAKTFQSLKKCKLLVDLPGFESPSIITGDEYRPDLLVSTSDKHLYVVKLTVGIESNLTNNVNRKKAKYKNLIRELDQNFTSVKFINLSVSSLGVFDKECHTFIDLPGFITPSVITGDQLRPDFLFAIENKVLYVLELTVGFETNLTSNSDRKHKIYLPLISDQESNYDKVKFVNVSISLLGVFGQSTNTLTDMLKELKFDKQQIKYIKKKIIAICIRASYYVFCQRNKDWTSPELLNF
ncbi:Hypothetical predicted protein, partial [Paramuricea clavata]